MCRVRFCDGACGIQKQGGFVADFYRHAERTIAHKTEYLLCKMVSVHDYGIHSGTYHAVYDNFQQ